MSSPLPAWLTNATDALRRLAGRPWTLFLLLLAMNAIARPCSSTAHDARLYSLQALNHAEQGAYSDDLFLRYGSQDQFTVFSRVVGPLVAMLGLRLAFFVFYLLFNTLFVLAVFRLVRALVDDTLVSTLALIYLVSAPLNYGGYDIFMVHEQFFTPRIIATTLTLFALERLVRQHFALALGLLIAGSLMHPLMAFGGMLIWAGYVACTYLPWRGFVGIIIACLIGGMLLLAIPALGTRLFGSIDEEWHQMIRRAVGYHYPDTWQWKDWINLALSFALPIAGLWVYRGDPVRQRFLLILVLAGAVGFLAMLAASVLPYALLFQAQPYRVLWILKVMQIPLGFLLIAHWSQSAVLGARLAALVLVAFFCVIHYIQQELLIFALVLPISIGLARLGAPPRHDWWWYGIARGFVVGAIGWMFYRWKFFLEQREIVAQHFDLNEWVLFDVVSPVFLIVVFCLAARFWQTASGFTALRWSAAVIAIVTPIVLTTAETSPAFRRDHTRLGDDFAFVRDFVHERRPAYSHYPNIYSPLGRPDLLWIDVKATSYFSILQTAGIMFQRATAEEIERRILLVNKFEIARQREEALFLDDGKKLGMAKFFKLDFDAPAPTREDLARLCAEPDLDFVVIQQEFPGLYSASNGRIFVYECDKVRSANSLHDTRSGLSLQATSLEPVLAANRGQFVE